ncbi:single-stranded DNA-binding protein [Fructilactobacillus sanfranciscensis]|uniref:single-stranded DNA-binding protein n=1 Tax=Fructilactobacillus sanfranciscensis TaxID=1625 RepID=UPI0013D578A6|nr:single-stranded DNA-binding protein [Fructilactobacillus sanfranciscensis]NDR97397.1 single-stranded DNA-binding protein [Fructilactobacillus sanfranciscensis]
MINTVVLTGRLTKDVDLKYTQSGTAVGQFNLAVNRSFKNANGEQEADFINCVIWRKAAENLANFAGKGTLIGVEGRLQTRNYENKQGQRVYVTEVVVNSFTFLESRQNNSQQNQTNNNGYQSHGSNHSTDSFTGEDQIDVTDDLPF